MKEGYYWVKCNEVWVIAHRYKGYWFLIGLEEPVTEYDLEYISPEPIPEPNF